MTTCAYKAGVLAVDRMASDDGLKWEADKLYFSRDKVRVAVGVVAVAKAMMLWLDTPAAERGDCPLTSDACVVEMDLETGAIGEWCAPGIFMEVQDRIAAWGSGRELAIGAMAAGATAEEAAEIALAWDPYSGFGVDVAYSAQGNEAEEDDGDEDAPLEECPF